MSIAPVASFPPATSEPSSNTSVGSVHSERPASIAVKEQVHPVSEALPKQESSAAKSVPSTYELPEDVVEVHQDPDIKDQIIIQYLDKAKDVVLQVPSSQELDVERGIAQDFQEAAKLREAATAAAAVAEGEKIHGD
jgi:hypothetical protein